MLEQIYCFIHKSLLFYVSDVVSLACKLKMEWVIVKGISGYADGTESKESWQAFGSATAASLAFHVLQDSAVFQDWPHYKGKQINFDLF